MSAGSSPEDGEFQFGSVRLPAGKRIRAGYEAPSPVAWVTREVVPEPGRAWAALSGARQETGLVPFLLGNLPGHPARPWDTEEFDQPADPGQLDDVAAVDVLAEMWDGQMPSDEEEEDEGEEWAQEYAQMRAPFGRQFPAWRHRRTRG